MQVLGNQNYFHNNNNCLPRQPLTNQSPLTQSDIPQQLNPSTSQKKKPMSTKSKRSLASDFPIQDFKQNNHKYKAFRHPEEVTNRSSNTRLQMAPFSSVVNTKGHNKNCDPIKSHQKPYESQSVPQNKKVQQSVSPKHESRKDIERIIENKLNHALENKRKSISYRIHVPPKQNNFYQQPKKQTHHEKNVETPELNKQEHRAQEQQPRALIVNKQKSSQSFIIRKKINSNALESQRNEKPHKYPTYCINNRDHDKFVPSPNQNSKNHHEAKNNEFNDPFESHTLSRFKPMEEQLKKLKERQVGKEMSIKPHNIKGIKCLKVRVNKVLKAQDQLFYEESFTSDKKQQEISKLSTDSKDNKAQPNVKQNSQPSDAKRRQVTIEEMLQNNKLNQQNIQQTEVQVLQKSLIISPSQKTNPKTSEQPEPTSDQVSLQQTNQKQQNLKSYKQTQQQALSIKNRKNRISSIRAIKNYYKKHDTEEKSSFITDEKEMKELNTVKKREKEPTCLTHKIKWGTASKKRLNSDRVVDAFGYHAHEFSIDDRNLAKRQNGFRSEKKQMENENKQKTTIQVELTVPATKKKNTNRVEFLQDQIQTNKFNQCQRTPKADKNLERVFAQTINSKEFIDYEAVPYHCGSKSLIIFQDPGISMIATNNNSIHVPSNQNEIITFEKQSANFCSIDRNDISPVPIMKRRAYDAVEERNSEENNPLQSLQELYYELKSHKSIHLKTNEEFRVESLQELCEG